MNDEATRRLEERLHRLIVDLRAIQAEYAERREDAAFLCETSIGKKQRADAVNDVILAAGYASVLEGVIEQIVNFWGLDA